MRYAGSKYTTKADAEAVSRYPSARNYGNEYLMTSSSSMMANRLGCNAGLSRNQLAGPQMANCQAQFGGTAINQSASNYGQFAGRSALSNQAAGSSSQLGSKSQGSLDLLIGSLFGL